MNKKNDFEMDCESIKKGFNDKREIVGMASEDIQEICEKHGFYANVYRTQDNELISLGVAGDDITNKEIDKITAYGEELYQISKKFVAIYLIGAPNVKFDVTKKVEANADLIIKFIPTEYSETYDVLRHLKGLLERREKFDENDLEALSMVPAMGPPEDKKYLRIECLKIWKEVVNRGLIK